MRAALCALLLAFTMACGGDDGGSTSPPPPGGGGSNQDVCAAVRSEAIEPERTAALAPPSSKRGRLDPSPHWRVLDSLWIHQQAADRRAISSLGPREASTSDIGDIAVIRDEGDVIVPANAFDLKGVGLRFTRNPSGGYDVRSSDSAFRTAIGNRITLSDDDTARADVSFSFPFFSGSERTAFVNSDGNITFREGDNASTDRSVGRLLTGPPRVAAFLADLDPSAGGTVFVNAVSDQYTVTWCAVRGFDSAQTTTAQTTLLPDGTIEMRFAAGITLPDAVIGLSPGQTLDFRTVDLSSQGPTSGGGTALGERFSENPDLDVVAVANTFYRSHPDAFDQLVIWTDTSVVSGNAFAFESTLANEIQGIGLDVFDTSREFGSAGRLQQLHVDGSPREVSRRPDARGSWARTARSACSDRKSGIAGSRMSISATTRVNAPKSCWAVTRPIGASSWTPMRRSWKATTSRRSAAARSGRLPRCAATAGSINMRWAWSAPLTCRRSSTSRAR